MQPLRSVLAIASAHSRLLPYYSMIVTKRVVAAVTGPTQKRQFISVAHKYKEAYERYGF
ncbi:hypothetical protein DYB36_008380, partial [Aphanomyces astaci]